MLGLYGKVRTLTTIIHEYVTNSLDACEEANILPDIDVKIDELGTEYYEVTNEFLKEARTAHRKKKEGAGDIGTEVHKAVEEWIKDKKEPDLDEQGMKMFNNFKTWSESKPSSIHMYFISSLPTKTFDIKWSSPITAIPTVKLISSKKPTSINAFL